MINRAYQKKKLSTPVLRDRILAGGAIFIFLAMGIRLGELQVVQASFYKSLASGEHDFFSKLLPVRGEILVHDRNSESLYPVAANHDLWTLYSDNRKLADARGAQTETDALAPLLVMAVDPAGKKPEEIIALGKAALGEKKADILKKLLTANDVYVPLGSGLSQDAAEKIKAFNFPNIGLAAEKARYYPEKDFSGQVLGFVGYEGSEKVGLYGLEGYWEKELAGVQGYLNARRDPRGSIVASDGAIKEKVDGSNIVLTIDRTLQVFVCGELKSWVEKYSATGGSVVMLDPQTGAVLAMCGAPDFDPNAFGKVGDPAVFNNPAIWNAYEPGSIMKTITMASSIDSGAITPTTTYVDTGREQYGDNVIQNADRKAHGVQTMIDVLNMSYNTGAIFAMRQIGPAKFLQYMKAFGFGTRTGIEMDTEAPGNLSSLGKPGEVGAAFASFGQGVTVTPLQMAVAYGAIANDGKLMKPHVVQEIDHADGTKIKIQPQMVRQVISEKTSSLVTGMLVSVVKNGEGHRAGVPGYLVAGKTGTAEIPKRDGSGYDETATIGSFAGFAPVSDPKFVLVVRIDRPQGVAFAENSAAPLWGNIASFALKYLEAVPDDTH